MPTLIGERSAGGNARDGSPFIVSFPPNAAPRLDGPIDSCSIGEIDGAALLVEADDTKMAACRKALDEWHFPEDFDFTEITRGDQPAVYLFRDRQSGEYSAYADMT